MPRRKKGAKPRRKKDEREAPPDQGERFPIPVDVIDLRFLNLKEVAPKAIVCVEWRSVVEC